MMTTTKKKLTRALLVLSCSCFGAVLYHGADEAAAFIISSPSPPAASFHSAATRSAAMHRQQMERQRQRLHNHRLRLQQLSDIDEMCIENVAELCLRTDLAVEGCDLEENEALVNQLVEQRRMLAEHAESVSKHVAKIDGLIARLQGGVVESGGGGEVEEDAYIPG